MPDPIDAVVTLTGTSGTKVFVGVYTSVDYGLSAPPILPVVLARVPQLTPNEEIAQKSLAQLLGVDLDAVQNLRMLSLAAATEAVPEIAMELIVAARQVEAEMYAVLEDGLEPENSDRAMPAKTLLSQVGDWHMEIDGAEQLLQSKFAKQLGTAFEGLD